MNDKVDITEHPDGRTTTIVDIDPERKKRDEAQPFVGHGIEYQRSSDITPKPIQWLWPNRFALGKVSILAGHPKLGKSQVSTSIASIVSTGGAFPVDRTTCEASRVVILSAEDDPKDTIVPRLILAGANRSMVFILGMVNVVHEDRVVRRPFSLEQDIVRLDGLIDVIGEVGLIIIDPLTAYLGSIDSHKVAEVRALLTPLTEFAARRGVAILCVSHLNKAGGREALLRVTGSLGFVAAARTTYLIIKDHEDDARRLFLCSGTNIAPAMPGLAYRVRGGEPVPGVPSSAVEWEPDPVDISADQAMEESADSGGNYAGAEAEKFLEDLLADGRVKQTEVKRVALANGLAWKTVRRAKDKLGVKSKKQGFIDGSSWCGSFQNSEGAHHSDGGTFDKIGRLRGLLAPITAERKIDLDAFFASLEPEDYEAYIDDPTLIRRMVEKFARGEQ